MIRKVTLFLLIFIVFTFFAPTMKIMRHFLISAIYAGSDDDDSTKYEEYDDESEDMSCCGESAPEETSPTTTNYGYQEDTSSDDMSCASTDDVDGDQDDTNNVPQCTPGTYRCLYGKAYSCNSAGQWVLIVDCYLQHKTCYTGVVSCLYDKLGNPIHYCCK